MKLASIALLSVAASASAATTHANGADSPLFPSNPAADASCVSDISSWFVTNPIQANAPTLPANSLTFSDDTNCDFYAWSWQMFLWLATPTGKDGGLVLNSDPFFDFDLETGALTSDAQLHLRSEKPDSTEQATGNALVWGDNNVVYFGIHTNDFYAFFADLNISGKLDPAATEFPTDYTVAGQVFLETLAQFQTVIADPQTLAMEIKSAWVDASTVPDKSDYITIQAEVPTYDTSSPSTWPENGNETIELALVGIHIVGSVKGHPEMIWASFEHQDNAPNDSFDYLDSTGATQTYSNFNTSGETTEDWLFMPSGEAKSDIPLDGSGDILANNNVDPSTGTITAATTGGTIEGQYVFRQSPWGVAAGQPTPPAESNAANATDIISINQNVLGQLADGDVRANYFLLGATWTNGEIPGVGSNVIVKGSQNLSNTTMETFIQPQNCFLCHTGGELAGLSHIYKHIDPTKFDPSSISAGRAAK